MTQHHDSASETHTSNCIAMTTPQAGTHCPPAFPFEKAERNPVACFYTTLQYNTIQYSTVQSSPAQHSTVHHTKLHCTTPFHYTNYLPLQVECQLYLRLCLRLLMLRRSLERYPGSPAAATCVLSESLRDPEAWRDLLFSRRLHCCSREQ